MVAASDLRNIHCCQLARAPSLWRHSIGEASSLDSQSIRWETHPSLPTWQCSIRETFVVHILSWPWRLATLRDKKDCPRLVSLQPFRFCKHLRRSCWHPVWPSYDIKPARQSLHELCRVQQEPPEIRPEAVDQDVRKLLCYRLKVCTGTHMCVCRCICIYVYTCIYICANVYIYIMYVYRMCIYIDMYTYTYIYKYKYTIHMPTRRLPLRTASKPCAVFRETVGRSEMEYEVWQGQNQCRLRGHGIWGILGRLGCLLLYLWGDRLRSRSPHMGSVVKLQ